MDIGVSTAIFWNYEQLDLQTAVNHAVEGLDFEAVEIHCEDPLFEGWGRTRGDVTRKVLREALSIADVDVSLHAPYHDVNIATFNERVRKEVKRQHKECIETANYLGANIVVIHPGFVSSRKFRREKAFQKMIENLDRFCEIAEDFGVTLSIENLASKEKAMGVKIPEIKRIINEVDRENLKVTLDIAHANTTEKGPKTYAEELETHIEHLHVSDNVGTDEHLSLGQGNIDFKNVFKEICPFEGMAIIEGWIPDNEDPFLKIGREKLSKIREELEQES